MSKSPEEMTETMIANLKEKTGRTLEEWVEIAKASQLTKHGAIVKYLKSEQGLTHGYAVLVAHKFRGTDAGSAGSPEELVDEQYGDDKEHLRPIYEKIIEAVGGFGPDVEVSPKKTYVSLRRSKQFAIVQPTTKTRIDLGLNLKGHATGGRLEESSGFNSMVSHRVRVKDISEVDAELLGWLREAYGEG